MNEARKIDARAGFIAMWCTFLILHSLIDWHLPNGIGIEIALFSILILAATTWQALASQKTLKRLAELEARSTVNLTL